MEASLDLSATPDHPLEPVRGFDEPSTQRRQDTRPVKHTTAGQPRRRDDEYERHGTRHLLVTGEPHGGYRAMSVTHQRKQPDVAQAINRMTQPPRSRGAPTMHLGLDHLHTHVAQSFIEPFGVRAAQGLRSRRRVHDTPKHASWLKRAEIDSGLLSSPSIRGRIPTEERRTKPASIWQESSNGARAMISWTFTVGDAQAQFQYHSEGQN
jgi:hypothetical protein